MSATDVTPSLRLVSGDATPEELAAVVAVLTALSAGDDGGTPPSRRSPWSDPGWRLSGALGASGRRDGWRTSGLPR